MQLSLADKKAFDLIGQKHREKLISFHCFSILIFFNNVLGALIVGCSGFLNLGLLNFIKTYLISIMTFNILTIAALIHCF